MATADPTGGIAVRLAALCLDDRGRLRDFALWDDAARGALLVDVARIGRLGHDEDSGTVDGTPTGFAPADRLLAAIEVEPEQSLDWWMEHGGVGLRDVAEAGVSAGRWVDRHRLPGRRYQDVSPQAGADGATDPRRPDAAWSPETAAVMVLGLACGAFGRPEPVLDDELAPTGGLRWICAAVTAHLETAQRRNLRAAGAADGGSNPYS